MRQPTHNRMTKSYLITADCRVEGQHVARGTPVQIDDNNQADKVLFGLLKHAGRLADDTPENRKELGTKEAPAPQKPPAGK